MSAFDLPLPTIVVDATYDWQWPRPPLACEVPDVRPDASEPCRVDTITGVSVTGDLVHFDADSAQMRFRMSRGGEPVLLPFSRVRRLTLTTPWRIARPMPGAPVERVPPHAQLRSFVVNLADGGSLIGVTRGRGKLAGTSNHRQVAGFQREGVIVLCRFRQIPALSCQLVQQSTVELICGEGSILDGGRRWLWRGDSHGGCFGLRQFCHRN